jgi:hypothetical protein
MGDCGGRFCGARCERVQGRRERLWEFVKRHVEWLLKADKLAVLGELERQEEVDLSEGKKYFGPASLISEMGSKLEACLRCLIWLDICFA